MTEILTEFYLISSKNYASFAFLDHLLFVEYKSINLAIY